MNTDFKLDAALVRQHFSHAAGTLHSADFLSRETSSRMAERLDYIRLDPARILDVGCGTGADLQPLAERFPAAEIFGVDFADRLLSMARPHRSLWEQVRGLNRPPHLACADANTLPLATGTFDLAWSNQLLHWISDPMPAFLEMQRVLRVGGMLMFATLGPDTLKELREAFPSGQGDRVHRFIDMHDLGDCLVKAGFSDPVMDMQMLTLTYPDIDSLFMDLRHSGSSNAACGRPKGLTGKAGWAAARSTLEHSAQENGQIPVSVELVFGHAWKAEPTHIGDGRAIIHFRSRPE